MKYILLFFTFFSISSYTVAQKKIEYYPDGKKSFEGNYIFKMMNIELSDQQESYFENPNIIISGNKRLTEINELSMFKPSKCYQGFCTFYNKDGSKKYEGNYNQGFKEGKFIYYYKNGKKAAERYYKNSMPDSTWTQWYADGTLGGIEHFKAIPQNRLAEKDSLYSEFFMAFFNGEISEYNRGINYDNITKNLKKDKITSSKYYNYLYQKDEHKYIDQLFNHLKLLPVNTYYDGDFTYYYPNGNKSYVYHFKNNIPIGTWQIWSTIKTKLFEMRFENEKVVAVKDYSSTNKNNISTYERIKDERINNLVEAMEDNAEAVPAEPPPIEAPKEVFTYVEQDAEFPGGKQQLITYIKSQLIYPKKANRKKIQGSVIISCVVELDGTLSAIEINKGIGYGCDEEAIRIVKTMPRWKPAKQNGKLVKAFVKIPVDFTIEK